jgi:hypothetical protein
VVVEPAARGGNLPLGTEISRKSLDVMVQIRRLPVGGDNQMVDEIEIGAVVPNPLGGDAVTIEIRFAGKEATIMLRPGVFLPRMKESDWWKELEALAAALRDLPILSRQ